MADQDEPHQHRHPHRRATLMPESFRNAGDHRASMMSESCRNSGDRYGRATMMPDMYRKSNERDHSVSLMPESRRNHFDDLRSYVLLRKDTKAICRIRCSKPSIAFPENWDISKFVKEVDVPSGLLSILIHPASVNDRQKAEWKTFMSYLKKSKKAAFANTGNGILYIMPPLPNEEFSYAVVKYLTQHQHTVTRTQTHFQTERPGCHSVESQPVTPRVETCTRSVSSAKETCSRSVTNTKAKSRPNEETGERSKTRLEDSGMGGVAPNGYTGDNLESRAENGKRSVSSPKGQTRPKKNYLCTNPSYLKTLGQTHSDWIFGAIAEFVDNSRDANATRLDISINMIYSHIAGQEIPMLEVVDDGHGMGHEDIFRMIAFGRKQSDTNDPSYIGTYGHGFKTATMKLGKDALVLTQTTNSRSVAFLSQSLNEGKDIVEIPIVTYTRIGQYMKLDTKIQSEASAKNNLKAIMEFSPFNEYFIGEKAGLFEKMGTGTHIYVWNLEKRGSEYSLEWDKGTIGGSTFHQGDIFIRSRRARSRLGQMTRQVSLDYSLRSFMEVIFLDPRIKITVQGSLVKSRPLAKCLHNTSIENGVVSGKPVQVFLGRSQVDFENGNCGIFVYWHGRLIEAYKRVGSMLHNGEKTHGVIGVIDVTDVMDDGSDTFLVHSNKQGFVDCEPYTLLENWLSEKADEYLVQTKYWKKRRYRHLKPDNEWLQCDKCRKWRMLPSDFNSQKLPQEWFCYMRPINGNCEMPEENLPDEVINLSSEQNEELPENIHDVETVQVNRRGPKRQCRKS